jgi:hypothetical protein
MDRRRESVRYLRETAVKLLEIAAGLEEPRTIEELRRVGTTRANRCTCDVCGSQITGSVFDGARCESTRTVDCVGGFGKAPCPGVYRLDPEPATDRAGNDLGVSLAELAEQGLRDFLANDPDWDEITETWPDIASTYRGRSR